MKLPVSKVQADPRAQPRAQLDAFLVDEYAEAMRAGEKFPPVAVVQDGDVYWLHDGFHRHAASKAAGLAEIDAEMTGRGTLRDAVLLSCAATYVELFARPKAKRAGWTYWGNEV